REVGEAPCRVQHPGINERARRACFNAANACAALIEAGRIWIERKAREDLREKDPGTQIFVDQAGVLPDPSDTGVLRVDGLLDRPRVNVGASLEVFIRDRSQPFDQSDEPPLDHGVIVVSPRVAGDGRARWVGVLTRVWTVRVVDDAERNYGSGGR